MTYYFFHDGSMQHGPFTAAQIQAKNLSDKTPVWYLGLKDWTTIGKVEELQPIPVQQAEQPVQKKTISKPKVIAIGAAASVTIVLLFLFSSSGTAGEHSVKYKTAATATENIASLPATEKRKHYRNQWENYIRLSNNKTIAAGTGLAPFDLYITNDTDCMLDKAQVIIHYLKDGKICGTKLITLEGIAAGTIARATAAANANADSARVSIRQITSSELNFSYPRNNGTADDPYLCSNF